MGEGYLLGVVPGNYTGNIHVMAIFGSALLLPGKFVFALSNLFIPLH